MSRTNLIVQGRFYSAWVNPNLSVENAGEGVNSTNSGTRDSVDGPVEDFDLFGNGQFLYEVEKGAKFHMILDFLGGRGIGKVELIRVFGYLLDVLFERNIFLNRRVEADAQTMIEGRLNLSPNCRVRIALTGQH